MESTTYSDCRLTGAERLRGLAGYKDEAWKGTDRVGSKADNIRYALSDVIRFQSDLVRLFNSNVIVANARSSIR